MVATGRIRSRVRSRAVALAGSALLGLALVSSDAAAQARDYASPFLPAGHWSVDVVRKLDRLGLAPRGFDAGVRSLRLGEVADLLAYAAAAPADARLAELVRGYQQRFAEEFGAWAEVAERATRTAAADGAQPAAAPTTGPTTRPQPDLRTRAWLAGGSIAAGFVHHDGEVLAGIGYSNVDWPGPRPGRDVSTPQAAAFVALSSRVLAAGATPRARSGNHGFHEAQAVLEVGRLGVWGGRRAQGYGPSAGGAIVFDDEVPLDGGGLFLTGPVRLPWVLRHLGDIRADLFLSRVTNGDVIRDPWLWGARVSLEPSSRLRLAINRGAMFGGEGNSAITLDKLWLMFRGEHAGAEGEFANQVLSVDASYRLPAGIPLVAYVEWGMDDLSGGYHRSPGLIAGLELAAIPGLPQAAIGLERASFAAASHKNTIWYRNWAMRGGWTDDGVPLAHPLAGHGREWMMYSRLDLLDARLRVRGDVRLRKRLDENLFAPDRSGDATAAALYAAWRARPWLDVGLAGAFERASGWDASRLSVDLRVMR